ncbi:MAG TPA: flagellar filament capping protein FliD [Steroidobacteraceae bacterium]|nr:flagellar filament capping protein FliD [Steroidobacteraceae bacterium]
MPTIQAPGIGSGLDVDSLVTQLVAAERAPYQTQITRRETNTTVQISALSSLKGALGAFRDALSNLNAEADFTPRAAKSGDEDVFTAGAGGGASTGSYDIRVIQLAKAQQLASTAYTAGSSAVIGTGKLTIKYGSTSFDVDIDANHNTLAGIRDAINSSGANTGVQATLLNGTDGTRLVLTSSKTGAANTIEITQSGGDGGLEQITYGPSNTTHMTVVQQAQNAQLEIAGFAHESPTNTVTDAIDGVTLTLKAVSDTPVTLDVSLDTGTLKQRITAFVTQYNSLYQTMAGLRSYDPNTKKGGAFLGDALLRGLEGQINSYLSNPVKGLAAPLNSLAAIGITKQVDGTLAVDDKKLTDALSSNSSAVAKIFGSTNGVGRQLYDYLDAQLKTGGPIDSRNTALQNDMRAIQNDTDALDARMQVVEARYRQQFTALDVMLSQLQTTSSYLASQLANLPKPG